MGSRLVAAALAVTLLGCGAEPKRAPAEGDEVTSMDVDRVDSMDCKAAVDEFARRLSEARAAGRSTAQVVTIGEVTNEVGAGFDPAVLRREVEQRLLELGLEVAPAGGQAQDGDIRPRGTVHLAASKEQLGPDASRYQVSCRLLEGPTVVVTSVSTFMKSRG